jgi:mRNA interferase MazF
MDIFKGDVVSVDLEPIIGSETGKIRPCLIVQNNINNEHSPTTIIVVITGRDRFKKKYPTHVWIDKGEGGLTKDSVIQCEQIRTIDKRRITIKLGSVNNDCLQKVEEAIKITLALGKYTL